MSVRKSSLVYILILLILLLTFFLRVVALNDAYIGHDEMSQYEENVSRLTFFELPFGERRIGAHTLALMWAKASALILGDRLFSLRWPVACFSVLGVALIFRIGTRLFGRTVGLTAAVLLAANPFAVFYVHDYRGYSGLVFYPLLAIFLTMRAMETGRSAYLYGVALVWAAGVYNHLYAALVWPVSILMIPVFTHPRLHRKPPRWLHGSLPVAATIAGVIVATLLALGPVLIRYTVKTLNNTPTGMHEVYIPQQPGNPATLFSTVSMFNGVNMDRLHYTNETAVYITLVLAAIAVLLGLVQWRSLRVLFVVGWLIVPVLVFLLGQMLAGSLEGRERYFMTLLPPFLLLVALAPSYLWSLVNKWLPVGRKVQYFIAAVTAITLVIIWAQPLQAMYRERTIVRWFEVSDYLASRMDPQQDIILCELYERDSMEDTKHNRMRCRENLTYWTRAKDLGMLYPVKHLDAATDYQQIASNLEAANRTGGVWLVVTDIPAEIDTRTLGYADIIEWTRFDRKTLVLPPHPDSSLIQSLAKHQEVLLTLPHTPRTQLEYHMSLAQLAHIQGQDEKAQREWQTAESLQAQVPGSDTMMDAARTNLDRPALMQSPSNPIKSYLGEDIRFDGFTLNPSSSIKPQSILKLTLFWRAINRPSDDYTVFVHVRDNAGNVVLQDDYLPSPNTTGWWPGDSTWETRTLAVPAETQLGEYHIHIGMYSVSTMERLPVDSSKAEPDNSILLTSIRVE